MAKQVFDKKFVIAASLIGFVYAAVIATLGSFVGKEVAGVAGVALTALATAIFKQFETLRFRSLAETDETQTLVVPKLSFARILLLCFSFSGAQILTGLVISTVLVMIDAVPDISRIDEISKLLSDWKIFSVVIGFKLVAFSFTGFLVRCIFQVPLYSELVVAAFIAIALPDLLPIAAIAFKDPSLLKVLFKLGQSGLWLAVFWLPFVACAFVGARIGRPSKSALRTAEAQQSVQPDDPASGGSAG